MKTLPMWVAGALLAVAAATLPDTAGAQAGSAPVSCKLPPQIRRLGRQATYLAPGRIIQTTAADCRTRGGEAKPVAGTAAAPATAPRGDGMAVMVGGDAAAAACPVAGEIVGLKPGSTLSVRAGPGTAHPRQDRLRNGDHVFVCDGTADEQWLGVVYPASSGQDCAVGAPIADAHAYTGPCKVGWVSAGWVKTEGR